MNVNKVQPFKYRLHFMRRICGRAGVKHFGFHAIRHITASILYHLGYGVASNGRGSILGCHFQNRNLPTYVRDHYIRSTENPPLILA